MSNGLTFEHYRSRAEEACTTVERLTLSISAYAAQLAKDLGADGRSAVVSQQLSKDIAFMDTVSDRNRFIQLSIMYSNLALLHKE